MNPETREIIERTERDGERLTEFLRNVRTKIGNPAFTPEDVDGLLAEAEEVCTET